MWRAPAARARRPSRPPRAAGFTFLELMVVLAVLSLIFTFGAIRLSGSLPKYALRTSAKNIGTEIERARLIAVSRGSWTGIRYHLDPDQPGYQVLPPAPLEFPNEPISERKPYVRKGLEAGVQFVAVRMRGTGEVQEKGIVDVYFSPTGTVGSHVVTLSASDGRMFTLAFNAITGTVDFYEGEGVDFEDFEG